MMANTGQDESSLCKENEATPSLREIGTITQTFEGTGRKHYFAEFFFLSIPKPNGTLMRKIMLLLFTEDTTMASSFGDERYFLGEGPVAGNTSPSCQDERMMDEKISPVEKQLQYLLNKADEFQTQVLLRCGSI